MQNETSSCTGINSSANSNVNQDNFCLKVPVTIQATADSAETLHSNLLEELRKTIQDLRSTEILRVIKTLAYGVFSKDELASRSLTGKRSIHSGDNARLPLEQTKLHAIEAVAMEKCPSLSHKEFVSKFQNIQKMLRRT